jgi:hypothetical protein
MVINKKEYKYELKREHIPLFTKILGKLDIKPAENTTTLNEIFLMISLIQQALLNFDTALEDTLIFIAAIYNVEPAEIKNLGLMNELKLWENFLSDKEIASFLSRVFRSRIGKKNSN